MDSPGPFRPARLAGRAGTFSPATAAWTVASAALVIAFSAWSRTDWAMAREASLRQRCSFVAATLAVGLRLWLTPFAAVRTGRTQ